MTAPDYQTPLRNSEIKALLEEAQAAGDAAQVTVCALALTGDADARAECVRVIADAQAQWDSDAEVRAWEDSRDDDLSEAS